jgi:predicted Rdx family selenoprotein
MHEQVKAGVALTQELRERRKAAGEHEMRTLRQAMRDSADPAAQIAPGHTKAQDQQQPRAR